MKNRFIQFLSLVALVGITASCDNDFNVSDDWSDVTVVYSLLDPAADTNWIRIERGYLGAAAASQSYGIPDSLYYDSLVVSLNEYNATGELVRSFTLDRDNTSRDRQPGVFTTNDYRLYRTTEPINEDFVYEVIVKQTNSKFTDVKARTEIVGGRKATGVDFGFINPLDINGAPSQFNGALELSQSKRAAIYQAYFTFRYREYDILTKEKVLKTISFKYGSIEGEAANATPVRFNSSMNLFNTMVANQVPVDENKLRFVHSMRIDVYAGGAQLAKYMILNAPSDGVNKEKPEFPQIEEGTGLFSSRTVLSLDSVDFPRANSGTGPYTSFIENFYLSGVLCDRNFVRVSSQDTLVCKVDPINGRQGKPYR